jgi:carbonic anhydrase-like protein
MDPEEPQRVYESAIPYGAARINAAAVYCSDGRIGDQVDDFLHQGLGLPRYDRVACPGGPVALAGSLLAFWESRGVEDQLRFLIRAHEVRQVLLVAHAGCAYYRLRLGIAPARAEREQKADLAIAAAVVQRLEPAVEVAGFFAHLDANQVWFERVFATEGIDTRLRRGSGSVRV